LKKLSWIIPSIILLVLIGGFRCWSLTPAGPEPAAIEALAGDPQVRVETNGWISFSPEVKTATKGLILYPGGRVDPQSYAPLAATIASQGCQVVILKPPFNLAVLILSVQPM
jgi:hypothetical protein